MKKSIAATLLLVILLFFAGCASSAKSAQVVATTGPVFQFTQRICQDTDITVSQLICEQTSCLHDYSLQVSQMQAASSAQVVVLSGAGLEDFMADVISGIETVIDSAEGVKVMSYGEDHSHEHQHSHGHHHEHDPHIWLSPENAQIMASNICAGLCEKYPAHSQSFQQNLESLINDLQALQKYGDNALANLSCRELITFHDGFAYFAHSFDLTILESMEEESGSEASAKDLQHLAELIQANDLPAIFTERNGSEAAAEAICRETGVQRYVLDMAMASDDYFASMYHNIDTIKEALK